MVVRRSHRLVRFVVLFLFFLIFVSPSLAHHRSGAAPASLHAQAAGGDVVINEIAWMGTSASSSDEWIELHNATSASVDISDWSIYGADTGACLNVADADGSTSTVIGAGGYLLYANDAGAVSDSGGGSLVDIWDATIGLNNSSPGQVVLYDAPDCTGAEIDRVNQVSGGWFAGDNASHASMERVEPAQSGTTAGNWGTNDTATRNGRDADGNPINGTPKQPNSVAATPATATATTGPTATATPASTSTPTASPAPSATFTPTPADTPTQTATPTPSASATLSPSATALPADLRINEVLPAPSAVDWDGDGTADYRDEWIELYNAGTVAIDLSGWQVDDAAGGSNPYTLNGTIQPEDFLLIYRSESGIALNNDGDSARLIAPNSTVADSVAFDSLDSDDSYSLDSTSSPPVWHEDWPPSPGAPNIAPTPTPTSTSTATPTQTLTPSATPSSTPAPTATPLPGGIQINEVLPAPSDVDWDGDGSADYRDEWIELYNAGSETVNLINWYVDDEAGGSSPHQIVTDTIAAPGEFVVLYRADTGLALNNDGDAARLIGPDGVVVDNINFDSLDSDVSFSRDSSGAWHDDWPPSPGEPNVPPTPTPTATATATPPAPSHLLISEVVYDGERSGDGDEFVEIFNPTDSTISLAGWGIGDAEVAGDGEGMYRFGDDFALAPGGTVVIARDAAAFHARFESWPAAEMNPDDDTESIPNLSRDTEWGSGNWALNNSGDEVVLLDPYNRTIDAVAFRHGEFDALGLTGHDISAPAPRSLQRVDDHRSTHLNDVLVYDQPTPGEIVQMPAPPAAPPPAPTFGNLHAYWGTLHAHTTYSDGRGPADFGFATARANGLHFMALSDHSNWFTSDEWRQLLYAADQATVPGEFVALRSFEWTSREQGHINVFGSSDYLNRDTPAGDSLDDFYAWLDAHPNALAQFNHPFAGHFNRFRFNANVADQLMLVETANGGGKPLRFGAAYWQALQNGWRVGAAGNLDTETPDWGDDGELRTGLLAPALTQNALLDAIRARRSFSTEDASMALALRAGSTWMGGEIGAGPVDLTLSISDRDREPVTLELWRAGAPVFKTTMTPRASVTTRGVSVDAAQGDILVARAVQPDGQQAWSSPIWVHGEWEPPTVFVNEALPAPRTRDWNGDGAATSDDEWIELFNPTGRSVGLTGWMLDDEIEGSRPYRIPLGTSIPAGGYLVLYKSETGVSLNDPGDVARLLAPDGTVVSILGYEHPPNEQSISRDGDGGLHYDWKITPGTVNEPYPVEIDTDGSGAGGAGPPTGDIPLRTIGNIRQAPPEYVITTEGRVSVPPGLLGDGIFYIQDGTAGLKVYYPDGILPPLIVGDRVRITGEIETYHGELELQPWYDDDIVVLGSGKPPAPVEVDGPLTARHEGRLVRVRGSVAGWRYNRWWLETGEGEVEIYLRKSTGLERPWLERGEQQTIVGVATTWDDSRRVLPATPEHLTGGAPLLMPVVGGD